MTERTALAEILAPRTGTADPALVRCIEGKPGWIQCFACGHRCRIAPGREGICKVRYNEGGLLKVPRGYVAALACDPIEKKPFFHADPGGLAVSFGMLGCDFHCAYCQNWEISQVIRDPDAEGSLRDISPEQIVESARKLGAGTVVSTYNEPLITSEWSMEVFRAARSAGLKTAYVSNGNGTPEVLDYLEPVIDFFKVDLKGFTDSGYRKLGGELKNVIWTISDLVRRGIWCEVVTLIVPGMNDSEEELTELAGWLAEVSPDIPWHCTAFHQDYRMKEHRGTTAGELIRASEIGKRAGLRYVYPGNLPGQVGERENTFCPECGSTVVERSGFRVKVCRLEDDGKCPDCGTVIPGRWGRVSRQTGSGIPFALRL